MSNFVKNNRSISQLLRAYKGFFSHALLLSMFINVLAFAVPIHMLQVYDRVLSSGHLETLWVITAMVLVALVFQSALDALRSRLLFGLGQTFEKQWRNGVFYFLLKDFAWKQRFAGASPWVMVQRTQQFVASPLMGALLDAPWVPLYVLVIFLFSPLLGTVALLGVLLMLLFALYNHWNTKHTTLEVLKANQQARDSMDLTIRHAEAVVGLGMQEDTRRIWINQGGFKCEVQQADGNTRRH